MSDSKKTYTHICVFENSSYLIFPLFLQTLVSIMGHSAIMAALAKMGNVYVNLVALESIVKIVIPVNQILVKMEVNA